MIATAVKLFAAAAWPSNLLGARAQQAKTFEWVADLTMAPRMEMPAVEGYKERSAQVLLIARMCASPKTKDGDDDSFTMSIVLIV